MLFGTSVLLGLIACMNVSGLLLARGTTRPRELVIRKALGANRRHLIYQLLAESAFLVALGATGGLALDAFLRRQLSYIRWPSAYNLPFEFHFQNDRGLFFYALAAAVVILLLSSLLPAIRSSNVDLGLAMKQGAPALSIRRWNLRNGFVALQLTLSVVLLTFGVLFARSFIHLANAKSWIQCVGHGNRSRVSATRTTARRSRLGLAGSRSSGHPASAGRKRCDFHRHSSAHGRAAFFAGSLAGIGLVLVLTGLYSAVSYATRRRTREMAIRAAIGAKRPTIVWAAIRDGVAVLASGILLGMPLAVAAISSVTDIVPDGVNPWNAGMFAAIAIVPLAIGAGAAWIPARQVANVDPALALREE